MLAQGNGHIINIGSLAGGLPNQGIAMYGASKAFLEAGKRQLQGDTVREASSDEVAELRKENEQLKQLVAEVSLKNRILKKSLSGLE